MAIRNWPLNTVPADTETDLVSPTANKEVAIGCLILCNDETEDSATVKVVLTDAENARLGTVWPGTLVAGESVHVDTKLFIAASATPDKIRVVSNKANVSFIVSGDES